MFRSIIRFGIFVLLLFILLMLMLSAGWIQILVNGQEISSDINSVGKGIVAKSQSALEQKINFNENRLFKFESHVVSPGETLFDLERSYGTNWKVIQRVNKIEDPLRLKVGTIIWVPVKIVDS